jgi:phytoene desaturase
MSTRKKAIIIGAGIAGIATAIRLAVKGYDTEIFEKNDVAGGKMYLIEKNGFFFDAGPSLFTQPQNIKELFEYADEPIEEYFNFSNVSLACRYFFESGIVVNAHTNKHEFARELNEKLGEPEQNVIDYLDESSRVYENVGNIFLNYSLKSISTWLHPRIFSAISSVGFSHLFSTLNSFNSKRLKTNEAVQIFNRFATYNGSNPYKAPGMLSLIPHLEQNEGTFYPQGGMISIPKALEALAIKKGVKFSFGKKVEKIVTDDNNIKGIQVEGIFHSADIVVSNVDVYYTFKNLLIDEANAKKILKNERSSSALIFYWGINKEFPDLHLHNIFFSADYQAEFQYLFENKKFFQDPTVYINITSKMEGGQAPEGKENWFVMINAPASEGINWEEEINTVRKNVIKKLSRIMGVDMATHIEVEEVLTPAGIQQRTDSYLGSLYGTSSNSKWAAFLRHANFTSDLKGLYFAGGSVHPGGGIPLCLKSAKIVCDLIKD